MNKSIEFDCFYQVKKGILSKLDILSNNELADNKSKLCLFSEIELNQQQIDFEQLVFSFDRELTFCLENGQTNFHWSIYADYSVLIELKQVLNHSELLDKFDYLMWPEMMISTPKLMLFDMDSTFIQIEVIDELAKCHQVGERVSLVTESAMRGELDFAQSLISRVACLKGLSESAIESIANNLPLSIGVTQLVDAGKTNQCFTAIVSGGFTPFVEKLKKELQLFEVKANHLELKNAKLTGQVIGEIVDAEAKAVFLRELCEQLDISVEQVIAIGDGANDLLMMQAAGFNLAYYAKPKVQQQANGRMNQSHLNRLIDLFGW